MRVFILLLVLAGFCVRNTTAQTLNSGLLGYFPFNNSTTDATGNMGLNSSANAGYGPNSLNQPNTALRLTGNGEVWIEPNGLLSFGTTGSFSFSTGFRSLASNTQAFFTNAGYATVSGTTGSGAHGWALGFDNTQVGRVVLSLVGASSANGDLSLATQNTYNDGLWHTAAATINRTTREVRIYVDGVAQQLVYLSIRPDYGTVNGTVFTMQSTASMFINLNPGYSTSRTGFLVNANRFGLALNGSVDEARFYNRAITAAEAMALHNTVVTTIRARVEQDMVKVAPIPAHGTFEVRLEANLVSDAPQLYNMLGQRVATAEKREGQWSFHRVPTGVYHVQVLTTQGVLLRRVVVE